MVRKSGFVTMGSIGFVAFAVVGIGATVQSPKAAPFANGTYGSYGIATSSAVWPWSSIGRINVVLGTGARSYCTGTLVGPRHVLTAAHCLYNSQLNSWVRPTQVHFVAGQSRDGQFAGTSVADKLRVNPAFSHAILGWKRWDSVPISAVQLDWAIVFLDHSLPLKPLPVRVIERADLPNATDPGEIARAGYAQDRPFALSIHRGCSAQTDLPQRDAIRHQCDSKPGDSGSPILLLNGNTASLVGIANSVLTTFEPGIGQKTLGAFGASATAFADAVAEAVGN